MILIILQDAHKCLMKKYIHTYIYLYIDICIYVCMYSILPIRDSGHWMVAGMLLCFFFWNLKAQLWPWKGKKKRRKNTVCTEKTDLKRNLNSMEFYLHWKRKKKKKSCEGCHGVFHFILPHRRPVVDGTAPLGSLVSKLALLWKEIHPIQCKPTNCVPLRFSRVWPIGLGNIPIITWS